MLLMKTVALIKGEAERVAAYYRQAGAARMSAAMFGESKLFIGALWGASEKVREAFFYDMVAYKQYLLRMLTAGEIALCRADLVEAMPARMVDFSETVERSPWGGECQYHFIRMDC